MHPAEFVAKFGIPVWLSAESRNGKDGRHGRREDQL
jgi:hypothetical protein